jgi:hypothetical protein
MRSVCRAIVPGAVVVVLSVFLAVPSSVAVAVAQTAPSSPIWAVVPTSSPTSSYNQLSGVSCASENACIAVGTSHAAGHSMFAELWDGSSWTLQQLPPLPAASEMGALSGVSCVTKNACMTVGYIQRANGSTLPLAESWNGTSWTAQTALPVPKSSTSSVLSAVSCASKADCVAVGSSDVAPAGDYVTLAEAWNGATWSIEATHNPAKASQLLAVSCLSATACTAVGSWQKPPPMGPRSGTKVLVEAWDGENWVVQEAPPLPSSPYGQLSGVGCTSVSACIAVGYSGLPGAAVPMAELWDGTAWAAEAAPGVSGAQATQLYAVSCGSATVCTAVGAGEFPSSTQTLVEAWDGSAWTVEPTPDPSVNSLSTISCTAPATCTAAGYSYQASDNSYATLVESE